MGFPSVSTWFPVRSALRSPFASRPLLRSHRPELSERLSQLGTALRHRFAVIALLCRIIAQFFRLSTPVSSRGFPFGGVVCPDFGPKRPRLGLFFCIPRKNFPHAAPKSCHIHKILCRPVHRSAAAIFPPPKKRCFLPPPVLYFFSTGAISLSKRL